MEILSSYNILQGQTTEKRPYVGIMQPMQMLRKEEKTDEWAKGCVDWYEYLGIKQLSLKYQRIIKNYRLAKGLIDKTDYIKEEGNEYNNVINTLLYEDEVTDAMSLDNFPIITNVINVLMGEFSRRNSKITVEAVDPFTRNEKLEAKYEQVKLYAENKAKQALYLKLLNSGYEIKSEEELQQLMSSVDEQVKSLPEIQTVFKKNYRTTIEQWATHQCKIDDERFHMYELETNAFYDYLVTDSQYWHIDLRENDYKVENWSPINTFCHKSPDTKYVSEGSCVGRIFMMSIPDVIESFGYQMTEEQITSLEKIYSTTFTPLPLGSRNSDYYDTSRSYYDQQPNSVNMQKLLSGLSMYGEGIQSSQSFFDWLNSTRAADPFNADFVRVTQLYYKTQQRVGKLTKINDDGSIEKDIVTEDYIITSTPIYDTSVEKDECESTLVYGEHIDWFWINEVRGGIKINTHIQQSYGRTEASIEPIYLGLGPIKFQFNSSDGLWGNRLPVEGVSCTDIRLNKAFSPVDLMKPYQIIYNLVNNQNKDLIIDENGTVIILDQNYLPQSSMGEDWGQNNLAKAYVAMKNFQMLPLDSSMANVGDRSNFSHFQAINLEQTNRFMSRLKIGEWAKFEAFAAIGITPQRLGNVTASESATGTSAAINNSYTQTESIFVNHSNFIMPRVRTAMIEAAQFYQSSNPLNNLQYTTEDGENVMFQIEGYKLLPRDIQVYASVKPNTKQLLQDMKKIIFENNTTGATIYDLLKIYSFDTPSQVLQAAKESVENFQNQEQIKRQHEQEMLDKQLAAQQQQDLTNKQFEADENQKDRVASYEEAVVKAMGFSNDTDLDKNQTPDLLELQKFSSSENQFQQKMNLEKEKLNSKKETDLRNYVSKEKDRLSKEKISQRQLDIAKENQTKAEILARKKPNAK